MEKKIYSVAVDGPSGAGKSTLAKAAAAKLGIVYVDDCKYRMIGDETALLNFLDNLK